MHDPRATVPDGLAGPLQRVVVHRLWDHIWLVEWLRCDFVDLGVGE